ncbi:hypothetical protein KJ764_05950 [Patescibacteria group bacterium]|nr:hypothetical protein [Patescibacteria group bacterium]
MGHVQRQHDDKKMAFVYDYVDDKVTMLKAMYYKRLRAYRQMGLVSKKGRKQVLHDENQLALF